MSLNVWFKIAEILVLVGDAIPPAPAVPASTGISARLKRVLAHRSPVNIVCGSGGRAWGAPRAGVRCRLGRGALALGAGILALSA